MKRVGVLALQGDFLEHIEMLNSLGVESREVRLPDELRDVDGLIIPGGESTTIGKIADSYGLVPAIRRHVESGKPLWGTCAGMIVMAANITYSMRGGQPLLAVMDITVQRNAFGRQVDSFEEVVRIPVLGSEPFPCVFIRAPKIESVGAGVQVLATLPSSGEVVAARQGRMLATSFHPELTKDTRVHRYFLSLDEAT
jgi:pyridoxal 5'-phosphate synthase pdxT subunit